MSKGLDWPSLMRIGLKDMRLNPDVFWSLTPAELRLMIGDLGKAAPMLGARLSDLMAAFPDENKGSNHD